jgi:hypothetical protein
MPMSALTFRRALALGLVLIATGLLGLSCSSLPSFVPDIAHRPARPVPLEGAGGPLTAAQSRVILQRLQRGGEPTDIFSRHLAVEEAIVGSPLTTGNAVRLLQDGPATYRAMLDAIAAARDHINLETYILDDDAIGRQFAQALLAKQAQGVQVKLLRDSAGTFSTPAAFFQRLSEAGVQVLEFNPVNPLTARDGWQWNQRDHRVSRRHQHQQRLLGRLLRQGPAGRSRRGAGLARHRSATAGPGGGRVAEALPGRLAKPARAAPAATRLLPAPAGDGSPGGARHRQFA